MPVAVPGCCIFSSAWLTDAKYCTWLARTRALEIRFGVLESSRKVLEFFCHLESGNPVFNASMLFAEHCKEQSIQCCDINHNNLSLIPLV